jgi:hypothetical protein
VQGRTDEPDSFAPLRWPGWLGSLGTFIGGISNDNPLTLGGMVLLLS